MTMTTTLEDTRTAAAAAAVAAAVASTSAGRRDLRRLCDAVYACSQYGDVGTPVLHK